MLLVSSLPFVVFDCIDLHMLCGLLGFRPPFSFRPPLGLVCLLRDISPPFGFDLCMLCGLLSFRAPFMSLSDLTVVLLRYRARVSS